MSETSSNPLFHMSRRLSMTYCSLGAPPEHLYGRARSGQPAPAFYQRNRDLRQHHKSRFAAGNPDPASAGHRERTGYLPERCLRDVSRYHLLPSPRSRRFPRNGVGSPTQHFKRREGPITLISRWGCCGGRSDEPAGGAMVSRPSARFVYTGCWRGDVEPGVGRSTDRAVG